MNKREPIFDPANVPYRQTPEYAAALERAKRDRARMRHRVGILNEPRRRDQVPANAG